MYKKRSLKITLSLAGLVGFIFAALPILDPYIFITIGSGFTLKINDILLLSLGAICAFKYGVSFSKNKELMVFSLSLLFLTVISCIYSSTDTAGAVKNVVIWLVYSILLMLIWNTPCRTQFAYWVEIIATVASLVVFLQLIAGYLGIPVWDGRLPFLSLGKYDGWSGYIDINTKDIRPCGIFQEASYVGIYLSVALAIALKENKMARAVMYCLAMFATTSLVAIIECVFVILYSLAKSKNLSISKKVKRNIILVIVISAFVLGYLITSNEMMQESFEYVMRRLNSMNSDLSGDRMGSSKLRLLGHIQLFSQYSVVQKAIGVGVLQFSQVFKVISYSNVWVTMLLDTGIIGLGILVLTLVSIKKKMHPSLSVYFWILILIFSSDFQWFSGYFFFMLSACILSSPLLNDNGSEKIK